MQIDSTLKNIIKELRTKHKCHTIILYGSRARGDFTSTSDYDVLGIKAGGNPMIRDARKVKGHYWDVFIYPEKKLKKIDETHMYLRGGLVLLEKNNYGSRILKRLEKIFAGGPRKKLKWEIQLEKTWLKKTLERSKTNDPEGNFRRLWLVMSLLENYFVLKKKWYKGSKQSLLWLKENDPRVYRLFTLALRKPHDFKTVNRLTNIVIRGNQ